MRANTTLSLTIIAVLTTIPLATAASAKTVETISCHDFITIQDRYKPQAISYVIGYNKAKHPEVKDVDLSGVERAVPVLVTSCTARPHETLLQRIRALWGRL